MRSIPLLVITVVVLLGGCSSLHPNKSVVVVDSDADSQTDSLPRATSLSAAKRQLAAYRNRYERAEQSLRTKIYDASDWSAAGATGGVAGGLLKSFELSVIGAVVGAAPTILVDRYKLETQASNFQTATKDMQCLNLKLLGQNDEDVELDVLTGMIDASVFNLKERQKSITLSPPNLAQIKADLQKLLDKKRETQAAVARLASDQNEIRNLSLEIDATERKVSGLRGGIAAIPLQSEKDSGKRKGEPVQNRFMELVNAQIADDLKRISRMQTERDALVKQKTSRNAEIAAAKKSELSAELATCVTPTI